MPGLMRGMARTAAVVGTASVVAGSVNHHQQQKYAQQDAQAQAQAQQAPVAAAPASTDMTQAQIDQLTQLSQLKDQGVITQAEFDAKKTQILGL
jgi:hypothetical protein